MLLIAIPRGAAERERTTRKATTDPDEYLLVTPRSDAAVRDADRCGKPGTRE